ncbi:unnamed protein product [Arctogadus glacialis]
MVQISTKNNDHGKTTTTSRIMDDGKTQQRTENADTGVEKTTRGITDNGTKEEAAEVSAVVVVEDADAVAVAAVVAEAAAAAVEALAVAEAAVAEAAALAVAEAAALAVAAAEAAEMEPLCCTVDDVVLPGDPPAGGAIGLGVGGGFEPGGRFEGWTIVEGSEKEASERQQRRWLEREASERQKRSWLEEMEVEAVSEADDPMDRGERKAELLAKRKAKKGKAEDTKKEKKKGVKARTFRSLPSAHT